MVRSFKAPFPLRPIAESGLWKGCYIRDREFFFVAPGEEVPADAIPFFQEKQTESSSGSRDS